MESTDQRSNSKGFQGSPAHLQQASHRVKCFGNMPSTSSWVCLLQKERTFRIEPFLSNNKRVSTNDEQIETAMN
eukprot:5165487-Amphidinium_carterae.1